MEMVLGESMVPDVLAFSLVVGGMPRLAIPRHIHNRVRRDVQRGLGMLSLRIHIQRHSVRENHVGRRFGMLAVLAWARHAVHAYMHRNHRRNQSVIR